jgi:hypothetical protein
MAEAFGHYKELATVLNGKVGGSWSSLEGDLGRSVQFAVRELQGESPPWNVPPDWSTAEFQEAAGFLQQSTDTAARIDEQGRNLARAFGMPDDTLSFRRIAELTELAGLVGAVDRPEAAWLTPVAQAELDQAASVLRELLTEFRRQQDALAASFKPEVLNLDLPGIRARFAEVHRGLAKMRKAYRTDKANLAACTVSGKASKAAIGRLDELERWAELAKRLNDAEGDYAAILGPHYYDREHADFERISRAIEVAKRALVLAGAELNAETLQRRLARGAETDAALSAVASATAIAVAAWRSEAATRLPGVVGLEDLEIGSLVRWCHVAARHLRTVRDAKSHVEQIAGGSWRLQAAADVLSLAAEAKNAAAVVDEDAAGSSALLGPQFRGLDTRWDAMRDSLSWAQSLRSLTGAPLSPRVAETMMVTQARPTELLGPLAAWRKAVQAVVELFQTERQQEVRQDLAARLDDAVDLLVALRDSVTDIETWSVYVDAGSFLDEVGLQPVTAFCVEARLSADVVPLVVERAALEAWADAVIHEDHDRLWPMAAGDRDALVADFRELDRQLVAAAAGKVVNACANRRPTSIVGAAGVVQREAQKQRKHMPIRELLSRAGSVALELKPCFMMSPLAVSQYLPPVMNFDVVIFDEASQVLPSDAINCVYRGRQLAGGGQAPLPATPRRGSVVG